MLIRSLHPQIDASGRSELTLEAAVRTVTFRSSRVNQDPFRLPLFQPLSPPKAQGRGQCKAAVGWARASRQQFRRFSRFPRRWLRSPLHLQPPALSHLRVLACHPRSLSNALTSESMTIPQWLQRRSPNRATTRTSRSTRTTARHRRYMTHSHHLRRPRSSRRPSLQPLLQRPPLPLLPRHLHPPHIGNKRQRPHTTCLRPIRWGLISVIITRARSSHRAGKAPMIPTLQAHSLPHPPMELMAQPLKKKVAERTRLNQSNKNNLPPGPGVCDIHLLPLLWICNNRVLRSCTHSSASSLSPRKLSQKQEENAKNEAGSSI